MTRKLLVTIALGAALAIIAAGTATSVTVGGAQVSTPTVGALPQCSNLSDDDGDGLVRPRRPRVQRPSRHLRVQRPDLGRLRWERRLRHDHLWWRQHDDDRRQRQLRRGQQHDNHQRQGDQEDRRHQEPGRSSASRPRRARAPSRSRPLRSRRSSSPPSAIPTARRPTPTRRRPSRTFGPAPIGVPNFVIDSFEIPPFLLPIYQACGTEYGIPWEVLASINKIETAFGTNLNVSTAGAMGWMQFIPSTWEAYGRRRQRRRPQGPLQPGRRDLRRRPLPQGRRRRQGPPPGDLRLQPRRLVRARRCCSTPRSYGKLPDRPGRLADRAHRGRPLPGRRRRPLRRRHLDAARR